VGEHDARVLPNTTEHRKEHVALKRLRFIHDDERVVQRPSTDVGQRQDFE
jgi:hypothetical protein